MFISIKDYLKTKNIEGDVILYRDASHKKDGLCKYLAQHIATDKTICCFSGGAFGLYVAKAFAGNDIVVCGQPSAEYLKQIDKLSNVTINTQIKETSPTSTKIRQFAEANGYFYINQFDEPLVKEYYSQRLAYILAELDGVRVDAFCDCGHSCATMAGFIDSRLADWQFVLGVTSDNRVAFHHLTDMQDKFVQETTKNFDTAKLKTEIEMMYPDFGNIFEATRSISAAMSWLTKNPGKTVLVYVGDSPALGE